jgi:carboxymethylenebutenolidase
VGHPVSLSTPSGRISGWRADPPIPPKGLLLVVQEIFGVNQHIRHVVNRFAAHGFIAVAPAFFDHIDYDIALDYDEAGVARGRELVDQLGFDRVLGDLGAIEESLRGDCKVGVVGYCWGGTVAFLANARLGLPAVSYYGARTFPILHQRLLAPMEFHFGERDPLIPPEHVAAHREMHPHAAIYTYPAGHGFNCDERADYDAASADAALDRTLNFFSRVLR